MKLYKFEDSEYEFMNLNNPIYSFDKEYLINALKDDWDSLSDRDNSLEYYISQIKEFDIHIPEEPCIICDYNEWDAEFKMVKFLHNTANLDCVDLTEYSHPEIYLIDEFGNIDKEPIDLDL